MKIGVFGDSYASVVNNNDKSWITLLKNKGMSIDVYGKPGTSMWYSYDLFFKHHYKYDTIVFCYTDNNRIPVMPEGLETRACIRKPTKSEQQRAIEEEEKLLSRIYQIYPLISSGSFSTYISQKIFNDVNEICSKNNTKLVNILPFEIISNPSINLVNSHGDCYTDIIKVTLKEEEYWNATDNDDNRFCHLSEFNNGVLADLVEESLNRNTKLIINAFKLPNFKYD